ncbi:hypothetical protein L4X63_17700 [Geomonas sp. Red32]|uniref:hypothetical protein n=1 Tax=Geomonas sp. Red32 TaxID=2912856 RepID=UPI00202CC5B2|nr:hypothetical protein [Geomonas sp. Red32]MCM0083422.1 hypothetical protein [Geomonas sp. Red32]
MRKRFREGVAKRLRLKDTWVVWFVLGMVMMNYPFLSIFNRPVLPFGLPLLYLYLLTGWFVSICTVYLFSRAARKENEKRDRH